MPIFFEVLTVLFSIIYLAIAIKRISKEERLIFFKRGRPKALAGPGLVLALPGIQVTRRINLGMRRIQLPKIRLNGRSGPVLVSGRLTWKIVDPLKSAVAPDLDARIEEELQSAFSKVILIASIHDCLCDGFTVENIAEDYANERLESFGVRVSKVECKDFPAHRLLITQIAGLLGGTIADLAFLTEQISEQMSR